MRELRHDFRERYGISYDDVPTAEAIDLALSLPCGSAYMAAITPEASWSSERHQMADVIDMLLIINWRLMGCPERFTPTPIERPGDRERRAHAQAKAKSALEKIENMQWEEA